MAKTRKNAVNIGVANAFSCYLTCADLNGASASLTLANCNSSLLFRSLFTSDFISDPVLVGIHSSIEVNP